MGKPRVTIKDKESFFLDRVLDEVRMRKLSSKKKKNGGKKDGK